MELGAIKEVRLKVTELIENGETDGALAIVTESKSYSNDIDYQLELELLVGQIKFDQGETEAALQVIDPLVQKSKDLRLNGLTVRTLILQAKCMRKIGEMVRSLDLLAKSENLILTENIKDLDSEASIYNLRGIIYDIKGDTDKSLDNYQQSLEIRKKLGQQAEIAKLINNIGMTNWGAGKHNLALENFFEVLEIFKSSDDQVKIGYVLHNIGLVHSTKGDLNSALEFVNQSLDIFRSSEYKEGMAMSHNTIGNVYLLQGELDQALNAYNEAATIFELLAYIEDLIFVLTNMGDVYFQKAEFQLAKNHLQRALEFYDEETITPQLSNILLILLEINLVEDNKNISEEYGNKLEELSKSSENKVIRLNYELGQAMLFKSDNRLKTKMRADDMFNKIISENIDLAATIIAMKHRCDYLLDELKLYGDEETLEEIKELLDKLVEIALEQNMFPTLIETFILQARLALLEGEINKSNEILENALSETELRGLVKLKNNVINEQENLLAEIDNMKELLDKSSTLYERLEKAKITEYLNFALKYAD
ncbi:MAG: tetratricopeptide repeat protein [Candidatus Kariarchaeaceae archaeon]|jgi:tetratricopeptide (TPR) repeat protein